MRKFLAFLFLGIAILLFTKLSFAQTQTPSTTTANLSFPIAELGNCSSAADCKTYCDDPMHLPACIAYAKEKGFYKQSTLDTNQTTVLTDAKVTLGCDSLVSCQTYCQDSAHASECSAFAKQHNLSGGQQQVSNQTLTKAEAAFGCTDVDSCRTFCEQAANQQTCSEFAKENGIKGGNQTVGPGGCTSESSCKIFCSDPNNFQACQQFFQSHTASGSGQPTFTGPGGCKDESSCKLYCQQNPIVCHVNPAGRVASLSATPSTSPIPTAMSPEVYCHLYPSHCTTSPILSPTSAQPTIYPNPTYTAYCESKGPGCILTPTNKCICPSPTPPHTQSALSNSPTPTSTITIFPTGTVKGIATKINFLQWLLQDIFHW